MSLYPQALRNRPHMSAAFCLGLVMALSSPASFGPVTRALIGWDTGVWAFLATIWYQMLKANPEDVRARATVNDENAVTVLTVISIATVASIMAIVLELGSTKGLALESKLMRAALTGLTLFGAWFLIPTIFAQHYARIFYASDPQAPALDFPDQGLEPDYLDLLYFSFTIALASQTADIGLRGRSARRTALAQSILAFYFNVTVLGLCVNIAASMVGG
ncbi:DUF1345 domain-containing protein [Caballeronia sp. S22]|uniref:DUF1345 domain-containing protein n=1 Tax=Caballeronia sp. S22 TaxID=3137182 RepID=UPI0035308746